VGVTLDLLPADPLKGRANRRDGRLHGLLMKHPRDELLAFLPADRLRFGKRLAAGVLRFRDPVLEVIHVAQGVAGPPRDGRVGVARAGDVDHQRGGGGGRRALRKRPRAKRRLLGPGGHDDHIRASGGGVTLVPRHPLGPEGAGGLLSALLGAVRHRNLRGRLP
jgi:hypothetical protein